MVPDLETDRLVLTRRAEGDMEACVAMDSRATPMTSSPDDITNIVQRIVISNLEKYRDFGRDISLDDDVVRTLRVDSDYLSFRFIPNVEKELGISVSQKDWYKVNTVREACEMLEAYYRNRMPE
jgi:acyl carrier protein